MTRRSIKIGSSPKILCLAVSEGTDALDLLQGICIKLSRDGVKLLNCGLATLLKNETIISAANRAEKKGVLEIELPIPIRDDTMVELFRTQNGRTAGVAFSIKM
ncbi:MAG: hypothetical protein ACD_56C00050G0004 [uncultured bacterium]|nr:MAG: hypothetical protein ACD_56C00050G0004 [uncultured bacterium]